MHFRQWQALFLNGFLWAVSVMHAVYLCWRLFAEAFWAEKCQTSLAFFHCPRKSLISNESRQWAPASTGTASFGWFERQGELKSGHLYLNEKWHSSASTNQKVETNRSPQIFFYSVVGRAVRAFFEALGSGDVNVQTVTLQNSLRACKLFWQDSHLCTKHAKSLKMLMMKVKV